MTNIEELRDAIKRVHGVDSKHVESVPVREEYQGQTVWKGVVEVFALFGHPKASQAYAWSQETDDNKKRHVTVLAVHPIVSAADAVRAAISRDYKNATAEETKRVGRPRLPKGHAKGKIVPIRFAGGDIRAIEAAARASNQTISEWVRSTIHATLQP